MGGDTHDSGIVAFAAETGETVWKATSERASYSSPVAVTVDGVRHLIFVTRLNVVSLNPENGKQRFRFPFGRVGPTVNAANPIVFDGQFFVTASYGIGAVLAKIKPDKAEVLWRIQTSWQASTRRASSMRATRSASKDGRIGRRPTCAASIPRHGKSSGRRPCFGYATLIQAGGKLLILTTEGTLVLAAANPKKYEELARHQITETTIRALPALADGMLYVCDSKLLKCYDLRPAKQ